MLSLVDYSFLFTEVFLNLAVSRSKDGGIVVFYQITISSVHSIYAHRKVFHQIFIFLRSRPKLARPILLLQSRSNCASDG